MLKMIENGHDEADFNKLISQLTFENKKYAIAVAQALLFTQNRGYGESVGKICEMAEICDYTDKGS